MEIFILFGVGSFFLFVSIVTHTVALDNIFFLLMPLCDNDFGLSMDEPTECQTTVESTVLTNVNFVGFSGPEKSQRLKRLQKGEIAYVQWLLYDVKCERFQSPADNRIQSQEVEKTKMCTRFD